MESRRARLDIIYEGVNISRDIAEDLLSFTHNDNASQNADDIAIVLKDNKGKWLKDWFPKKGDKLKAELVLKNWDSEGDQQRLDLGTFVVDEPKYNILPSQLSLNAISIPNNANFTDSPISKGWNKITLKSLIGQIASVHNLTLLYDTKFSPMIDRVDQSEMSDMNFIAGLTQKYGLACKISDKKIIVYSMAEYEQKAPVLTIQRDAGVVLNGELTTKPIFSGVKLSYTAPKTSKKISYTFGTPDKLFTMNQSVASQAEAEQVAKAKLRELNQNGFTADLTLIGTVKLVAGVVIILAGFGYFDGRYFVDKVTQTLPEFTVSITIHKILTEGY